MTSHPNRQKATLILKQSLIKNAPVDLDKIAKDLGFNILKYPFPEKRKGMVLIEKGVKAIGVNSNHPICMQRYTIAHELGHFLNGHEHEENKFINDDKRFFDPYFKQEREADGFAAELLMPVDFLNKDLSEIGLDLDKLTELYQVSKKAMDIRLKNLRLYEKY